MSDKKMNDKEQVTTRIRSLGRDFKTALDILEQITDPDPCRLDHNGHCQAHYWFYTEESCAQARAKELLAKYGRTV